MEKNLAKIYRLSSKIFPDISNSCRKCDTCCQTYGWLLKKEAKIFTQKGYPVVKINNRLFCINSFKRDKNGKIITDEIPTCIFYKIRSCSIYKNRPLDCRLFPIKIKFGKEKSYLGLSLGCRYISSLSQTQKNRICKNIIKFLKKVPRETINEYLNLMYQVNLISKPKRFWLKKIIEIKKKNHYWETEVL